MLPIETNTPLKDKDVAILLRMSLAWVRKDRGTNRLLPFYHVNTRVFYDRDAVLKAFANGYGSCAQ